MCCQQRESQTASARARERARMRGLVTGREGSRGIFWASGQKSTIEAGSTGRARQKRQAAKQRCNLCMQPLDATASPCFRCMHPVPCMLFFISHYTTSHTTIGVRRIKTLRRSFKDAREKERPIQRGQGSFDARDAPSPLHPTTRDEAEQDGSGEGRKDLRPRPHET
jgi:hypothetical protein